jgi:hypothetical protein
LATLLFSGVFVMKSIGLGCVTLALVACGGGSTSDAGRDAPLTLELNCQSYCQGVAAVCTGAHQQYSDMASCLGTCAGLPVGTAADTGGNTLGCRLYHVSEVPSVGQDHCHHAGPAGEVECGENCEGFCSVALHSCASEYPTLQACMDECAMFPETVEYSSSVTSGNSFACRMYHLTVASTNATLAMQHCPHIRMNSSQCQ